MEKKGNKERTNNIMRFFPVTEISSLTDEMKAIYMINSDYWNSSYVTLKLLSHDINLKY